MLNDGNDVISRRSGRLCKLPSYYTDLIRCLDGKSDSISIHSCNCDFDITVYDQRLIFFPS